MLPNKGRILCIEPFSDICELVCQLLRMRGYESDSASTLAEAVRMAASGEYSLYILGGHYPDGTNAELAARLRAATPTVPVIVFSAQVLKRDRGAAMAAGASAFLTKPDGLAELPQTVERLLVPRKL